MHRGSISRLSWSHQLYCFLIGASFLGYFIFGLYMLLRGLPKEATHLQDLGWITANVFENKLFNAGALALSLYFATQASWSEFDSTAQGFVDMWKMSKFVCVSSIDPSNLDTNYCCADFSRLVPSQKS
jgi:hypothetical protein